MPNIRRRWTPEERAQVVAHAKEHGVNAAQEHFKVAAASMVRRWMRGETGRHVSRGKPRPRKWTPKKVAQVLEYLKTHSNEETREHFKISTAQIYLWKNKLPQGHYTYKARKAPPTNGLGVLDLEEQDALMWLERWRTAYFDRLKAETPSAASVLAALRERR